MELSSTAIEVGSLMTVIAVASWVDLKLFGRSRRQPSFGSAVIWSIGWLGLALVAALVIWPARGGDDAVLFLTVYMIERSLSLDNVFVFLLLFSYFAVPAEHRPRLIIVGIIMALGLRGLAILGGLELLDRFEPLVFVLAAGLLILAGRIARGVEEIEPDRNVMVRLARRMFPVETVNHGGRWLLRIGGRWHATPLFLCFVGIVFTDLVFAIDSIPAAFGVTRDPFVIWSANVFALLGLRALIVVVERLLERFAYLDQTIAVVLGVIAIKLITEEAGWIHIGPLASLALVGGIIGTGILISIVRGERKVRIEPPGRPRIEGP